MMLSWQRPGCVCAGDTASVLGGASGLGCAATVSASCCCAAGAAAAFGAGAATGAVDGDCDGLLLKLVGLSRMSKK